MRDLLAGLVLSIYLAGAVVTFAVLKNYTEAGNIRSAAYASIWPLYVAAELWRVNR